MKIPTIGSILTAFFSSLCCIGPFLFTTLGVGAGATGFLASTADFAKALVPYRPYFIGLTFILLAMGFFSVYRKKARCEADSSCSIKTLQRTKVTLLAVTVIAIILILMPYLLAIGS